MKKKSFNAFLTWDTMLVISVFLCAFVIPVIPVTWGNAPVRVGFTMIFIFGLLTMEKRQWYMLYLALATFVMEWISGVLDFEAVIIISKALNILFFLIVIFSLIREMATAKIVTARVIMSSISGYLLLGIVFSVAIAAIIQRDPEAFNVPRAVIMTGDARPHLSESMYFGFVTLASLGYGDILPLKPYTRSLATLITISGQLYIATIIGILIGKFSSGSNPGNK